MLLGNKPMSSEVQISVVDLLAKVLVIYRLSQGIT
jgi:hypothetical protein